MKTVFQTKLLQHMIQKKKANEGFTLIELLVVIIIIGILAAIALPSFLNQANKARESEAKQYVGSMNRTEQAYFLENKLFTTDITALGLGIKSGTSNYTYSIPTGTSDSAISVSYPINTNTLRAHAGGVQVGQVSTSAGGTTETTTKAILCQSDKPKAGDPAGVTLTPNTTTDPKCGPNYSTLDK